MYRVIEELLELSYKADKVIDTAFVNDDFEESFLCAKNTLQQIMNGIFPKYDSLPHLMGRKSDRKKMLTHSCCINLRSKLFAHTKNSLSSAIQNVESNDSGVVFVSSSDTEENFTMKHKNVMEFDESDKAPKSQMLSSTECMDVENENSNVIFPEFKNSTISSKQKLIEKSLCIQTTLDSEIQKTTVEDKESEFITNTPMNSKISLDCEEILHKRHHTRSVTNYCREKGISLDGSFHKVNSSLNKADVLNRTYVINSTSSDDSMEVVSNKTYVICSTSSEENNEATIVLKDSGDNMEVSTSKSPLITNYQVKLVTNHDKQMESNDSNVVEKVITGDVIISVQNKKENSPKNEIRNICYEKNITNTTNIHKNSSESGLPIIKHHTIKSLNNKETIKEQYDKNIATDFQNCYQKANTLSLKKSLNLGRSSYSISAQNSNKVSKSHSYLEKRKLSSYSSSDGGISGVKKITEVRKTSAKKLCGREFETNSSPVYRRNNLVTPVKFNFDNNRQSLKDKAEEKRKHREIRVQKTKERRERLQREKEEKRRLSEQKLKQRFEQHEKILRQKINNFRKKLRNQQQGNTRQYNSSTSTSSKDSNEGRVKDNNAFRNGEESSQQLSKVGNSNHDVVLKKDAPNSLQGNVGQNPADSDQHHSIVTCKKTPVDFSTYTGGTESGKIILVTENITDIKNGCIKSDTSKILSESGSSKINSSTPCQFERSNIIKSGQFQAKRNSVLLDKTNSEINQFKPNDAFKLLSEEVSSIKDVTDAPYFMRSEQKQYSNNTSISFTGTKTEIDKGSQKYENVALSVDGESSGCNYSCFSSFKSKKNLKNNSKVPTKSRISTQAKKRKRRLKNSQSGIVKKFFTKKALVKKETSYKISDIHERSFDESKIDYSKIPLWATGPYLKQALIQQYYKSPNLEEIFGTISDEIVDLRAIFQMDKPEYHRRTSSEKWSATDTPS